MEIAGRFGLTLGEFRLEAEFHCPGEGLTAVVGPSGSGKTTLLQCIAGLHRAPGGYLSVNGRVWQDGDTFLPTHLRPLGYVFQNARLFPHLTVEGNLEYGRKRSRTTGRIDCREVLDVLDIRRLLPRRVHNLSGGEAQRVAMARALYRDPDILLLDEPLASLDGELKREVVPYVRTLKTFHIPIVYVTHSDDEVRQLADYRLCVREGRVVAAGEMQ